MEDIIKRFLFLFSLTTKKGVILKEEKKERKIEEKDEKDAPRETKTEVDGANEPAATHSYFRLLGAKII